MVRAESDTDMGIDLNEVRPCIKLQSFIDSCGFV